MYCSLLVSKRIVTVIRFAEAARSVAVAVTDSRGFISQACYRLMSTTEASSNLANEARPVMPRGPSLSSVV